MLFKEKSVVNQTGGKGTTNIKNQTTVLPVFIRTLCSIPVDDLLVILLTSSTILSLETKVFLLRLLHNLDVTKIVLVILVLFHNLDVTEIVLVVLIIFVRALLLVHLVHLLTVRLLQIKSRDFLNPKNHELESSSSHEGYIRSPTVCDTQDEDEDSR